MRSKAPVQAKMFDSCGCLVGLCKLQIDAPSLSSQTLLLMRRMPRQQHARSCLPKRASLRHLEAKWSNGKNSSAKYTCVGQRKITSSILRITKAKRIQTVDGNAGNGYW